jgi:hypothetical protein
MVLAHYSHSFVVINNYFSTMFFESKCLRFIEHILSCTCMTYDLTYPPKVSFVFYIYLHEILNSVRFPILQSFNYGPSTMHIYTTIDSIGIHLYNVFTSIRIQECMMQCVTHLNPLLMKSTSMWNKSDYLHVHVPFNYIQLLWLIC